MTEGLEHGGYHDTVSREHIRKRYYAQCAAADGEHFFIGVEEKQQLIGNDLKDDKSDDHHRDRIYYGKAHGLFHAVGALCSVVERNYRDHAVCQSEHRHENEALKLEVRAENGDTN